MADELLQSFIGALPAIMSFLAVAFSLWVGIRDRQSVRYKSDSEAASVLSKASAEQVRLAWEQVRELRKELDDLRDRYDDMESTVNAAIGYIHSLRAQLRASQPHASIPDEPPEVTRWRGRSG